jgi:predicted nuclease of predicted toxin-antitoxin system
MKFIVDAQLPKRLSVFLNEKGHDSIYTLELPKKNATSDVEINALSITEKRIVVSKDSNFYNSFLAKLEPHKLLQVSTGNIKTQELMTPFDKNLTKIIEEISHNSVVEITRDSLITII